MQAVILAGGLGTRLSEETQVRPKPMVEIGGKPILWHIMKIYSDQGVNDFVVCCGYKGYMIKEYFFNYALHNSDIEVNTKSNTIQVLRKNEEDWNVLLVDTGLSTMTGGRLKRVESYIRSDRFYMTYGDGLGNVDISKELDSHKRSGKLVTVTSVKPPGRYGTLVIEDGSVTRFEEKPSGEQGCINGGFFIIEKKALSIIESDSCMWEDEPMKHLARTKQLNAYTHDGFWHAMDTLRDRNVLQGLCDSGKFPWRKING